MVAAVGTLRVLVIWSWCKFQRTACSAEFGKSFTEQVILLAVGISSRQYRSMRFTVDNGGRNEAVSD